jgi:hypothetical protein
MQLVDSHAVVLMYGRIAKSPINPGLFHLNSNNRLAKSVETIHFGSPLFSVE